MPSRRRATSFAEAWATRIAGCPACLSSRINVLAGGDEPMSFAQRKRWDLTAAQAMTGAVLRAV